MKYRYIILPLENHGDEPLGTNDRRTARKWAKDLDDMGTVLDCEKGTVLTPTASQDYEVRPLEDR